MIPIIKYITETRFKTKTFDSWLVGASLLRNRLEVLLDSDNLLEGNFVSGLAGFNQETFGKRLLETLDETEVLDRASGKSKHFTL